MDFTGFLGNDAVKARLSGAFASGRVAHSYLLCGPAGSGKHTLTRILSAAMQCEGRSGKIPCGVCSGCRKALEGVHPDIITVDDPDHKAMTVDPIRAARSDMFIRPNEGACKVYIFPDCTRLNEKDQNVLLKTVEEGPSYAAFLFCAENASVLLPTIRSRCVEVKLPPAGTVGEDDERTRELLRLIAEGRAAARAAFLLKLETAKATREELAALFEGARVILADALCTLCGAPPAEPRDEQALRAVLGSRLTKAQILGTIELLETYRNHCEYNVGVGPLLGGLAVELEEIL